MASEQVSGIDTGEIDFNAGSLEDITDPRVFEAAHDAYHRHAETCKCRTVGHLTKHIALATLAAHAALDTPDDTDAEWREKLRLLDGVDKGVRLVRYFEKRLERVEAEGDQLTREREEWQARAISRGKENDELRDEIARLRRSFPVDQLREYDRRRKEAA